MEKCISESTLTTTFILNILLELKKTEVLGVPLVTKWY